MSSWWLRRHQPVCVCLAEQVGFNTWYWLHCACRVGIAVVFTALFHQRSGVGAKQGVHQQQRRQAAVAMGERMPHTRQSCAGAAQHKDTGQPDSKQQQQQAHGSVAFRALSGGGGGGALATMHEGAAAPPAAMSPPPTSPVVYAGRPSDPNCCGVADVHPSLGQSHVVHRTHVAPAAPSAGSEPAPQQHPGSDHLSATAAAGGGAAAKKKQRLDLATLWSRGAGRIDPTTAAAAEHRKK